jgi:Zn-dependent peptidase ImmA (M78 family)
MSSSTQKGNLLEKKAFELLSELLANDEFYVSGKKSKIFSKKPYYSERRKKDIIFDITIETYLNDAENYSLLTILECKNLNKKVTVDDVEEFESKISQIGEHNTKGIMITNSSFQESAYNLAASLKIGLIRITSDDKFEWINYRKNQKDYSLPKDEIKEKFTTDSIPDTKFIATIDDKPILNFADLLIATGAIDYYQDKEKFINIPFLTEEKIDEIVGRLIKYDVFTGDKINTDKLCTFLSSRYPLAFDFDTSLPNNLLGKIQFNPLMITVTKSLKADLHRWRFTLAHEIGHLVLHRKYLDNRIDDKTDTEYSLSLKYNITDRTSKRLEIQANIFASHLLLPIETLSKTVLKYFTEERIHKGRLYLDNQPVNQRLVFTLLSQISTRYEVSMEVAKIRLIELGLLEDDSMTSLKTIFKEMGIKGLW